MNVLVGSEYLLSDFISNTESVTEIEGDQERVSQYSLASTINLNNLWKYKNNDN